MYDWNFQFHILKQLVNGKTPKSLQASATKCKVISSSQTSCVRKVSWTPASSLCMMMMMILGRQYVYFLICFKNVTEMCFCCKNSLIKQTDFEKFNSLKEKFFFYLSLTHASSPNFSTTSDFKQALINPYCQEYNKQIRPAEKLR